MDKGKRSKTKASSSSEAASLLASGGFVGFDSVYGGDTGNAFLPNEYQLAFKKLSKKDTVTKLKGFGELKALFPSLSEEIKSAVLENWVQAFNRAGMDNDRQVREAVHETFLVLIQQVKKDLATVLKRIIGVWLCNQFDPFREVRNCAQSTFKAAIPRKQSEALVFCKNELLEQLGENLRQTPQTLSDVKTVGDAEAQERYERFISCSLFALDFAIDQLPPAENERLMEKYSGLLDDAFWKLLSSKSTLIRKAAYQLANTAILRLPDLVTSRLKSLTGVVVNVLSDREPQTHAAMWGLILTFFQKYPTAWSEVNLRKQFLPKLFGFFRAGTYGSAGASYPSVLPLLAQLITNANALEGEPQAFYKEFFSNLWLGLQADDAVISESGSLVAAFMECVLYSAITHVKKSQPQIASFVLTGPFFETFREFLSKEKPLFALSAYQKAAAEVIYKLIARGESFEPLISQFWASIEEIAVVQLAEANSDTSPAAFSLFAYHFVAFLEALNAAHLAALKSAQELSASTASASVSASPLSSSTSGTAAAAPVAPESPFAISQSTSRFLKALFSNAMTSSRKKGHLAQLKLCSQLATVCGTKNVLAVPLREFLQHDVIPWIGEIAGTSAPEELLGALFELARASLLELRADEASENWNTLLKAILAVKNPSMHALLIEKVCTHGGAERWASQSLDNYVIESVSALAQSLPGSADRNAQKKLLSLLFSACSSPSSTILSIDTLVSILQRLNSAVLSESKGLSDTRPLNSTSLRHLSDVLDVCAAFISSPLFAKVLPNDTNAVKFDLLQQIFLFRVSFVPQKEESANSDPLSPPANSYALALVAKKCWQRISASSRDVLKESPSAADQFFTSTCRHLVRRLADSTATHFSMDVFVETARDLEELAVVVRGTSAEGRRLVLDHLAVPRDEFLRIRNQAFSKLVSGVDTLQRSPFIRFTAAQPNSSDLSASVSLWIRLVHFAVRLTRDFGLSLSELSSENESNALWILAELLLARDLSNESHIHAEMRSFVSVLSHGSILSAASVDSLVNKKNLNDEKRWLAISQFLNESLIRGGLEAFVLQLVLRSLPIGFVSSNRFVEFLTAEDRSARLGFADTLHVLLSHLKSSNGFDPLKAKIFGAFLEITPEVISTNAMNPDSMAKTVNTIESLNAFLLHSPEQKEETRRLQSFLLQIQSWFFKSPSSAAWRDITANSDLYSSLAVLLADIVSRTARAGEELLATQMEFLLSFCLDLIKTPPSASQPAQFRRHYCALSLAKALVLYPSQLKSEFFDRISKFRQQVSEALCEQIIAFSATQFIGSAQTLYSHVSQWLLSDTHYVPEKTKLDSLYPLLIASHFELQKAAYVLITHAQPKADEASSSAPSPSKSASAVALDNSGVSEQIDENAMRAEQQSNLNSLPKPLLALAQRDILQPQFSAAVICDQLHWTSESQQNLHLVYGYLLAWNVLLDLLVYSPKQRSRMSAHLRHNEMFSRFLVSLFQYLTPPDDEKYRPDSLKIEDVKPTRESLSLFAYYLYYRSVKYLPALVRIWWVDDCERNSAQLVEKFTTKYLSPNLIDSEFKQINEYVNKADNFSLKASKAANEVQAVYEKDELKLGITVKVPSSYPLRSVELDCVKRVGAPETLWRKWLLSMTTLLLTQDASILDAILLWKQSLDSHFEGVECCPICYCVFHASNHSLPKLACKTCKNKFHHACMYKWFQTSHKSNCPLCQTPFSFEKHL